MCACLGYIKIYATLCNHKVVKQRTNDHSADVQKCENQDCSNTSMLAYMINIFATPQTSSWCRIGIDIE